MLLGFLCTSEAEFDDFCDRVARLPHKIFAVADEPPMWSEDEDGLESVSEPVSDLDGSDSDRGDEDEDEILAPAPVAKGQGEFGHGLKRPLGPHRDDTITQLNAAAAGLALGSDADYEIDFDESRARKVSAASTVSQRRYVPRIVDTDTDTDDAVDIAADEADLPTPIATAAPALEAISHPVQPRARPARFAKAKRLPREIVDEYARVDAEPEREPEPKAKAKLRAESESAKAKPIDASSDDDVPPSVPPKSPVPRKEGDAVADADADAETDVEADPDMSFEDIGKPEALAATETEADADADADAEVELGSTPSSIPDLVEHPSPHRA
jgi:hypothetical protein